MFLIKYRLKRLITLDCNEYTVLFTDQIFTKTFFNEKPGQALVLKHMAEPFKRSTELSKRSAAHLKP